MPQLLEVHGLTKFFPVKAGGFASQHGKMLRAVYNVSLQVQAGQTLGLVGESGCGKSTTGRLVLRLIEPTAGSIKLNGREITGLSISQLKPLRSEMQIVFQDPLSSLDPRQTAGSIVGEPLVVHGVSRAKHQQRVAELFQDVELPPESAQRYPHEFSGGQRQRISIARALALRPALIIADEPVSALDASIQSQILALLKRLQRDYGLAYLFISHDLAVVRFISHFVAVMYLGEIVECGPVESVYLQPNHPYTQALLAAIPRPEPQAKQVEPLGGLLPDATDPPPGCAFASRCPYAMERCEREAPPVYAVRKRHTSRCWLNEGTAPTSEEQC
jgi:oligopeptide/dipeptide ABC transporter ATP-binding protein